MGSGRARLTDLTEEAGLPRTTVYRLLGRLAAVGAVERIGAHYRLGPGLLSLGQHVTPMERLRAIAQRPLIELAAATPAHVGLGTTTAQRADVPGGSQGPGPAAAAAASRASPCPRAPRGRGC